MDQEIAQLDIIILQAASRASAPKAALARASKRKAKWKEQLELIQTIKANNFMTEEKIKAEKLEDDYMKVDEQAGEHPVSTIS